MDSINDSKKKEKLSIAKCTRIIDEMLSLNKGRVVSATEVYERLESTFHWVENGSTYISTNESEETKYKKNYKPIYIDAIVRLLKILKDKSEIKYLIVSDYPQDKVETRLIDDILNGHYNIDDAKFQYYDTREDNKPPFSTFKDEHGNATDKIYTIECALIIDEMLSAGKPVTTQMIYDELERTFNLTTLSKKSQEISFKQLDYKGKCKEVYSAVCKEAIQRLLKELRLKGKSDILVIGKDKDDKRQREYQYTEPGFSVFKAKTPQNLNPIETEIESLAQRLFMSSRKPKKEESNDDTRPIDSQEILERTINAIWRVYSVSKETRFDSVEIEFQRELENLLQIKNTRSNDWITQFSSLLLQIKNKYSSILPPLVYADFLIEYADFIATVDIAQEELSKELDESVFEFSQNLYESAITRAREAKDKERLALFLIKYGEFLNKNRQFHIVIDKCEKAIKIYEQLISGNSDYLQGEYASAIHLYANYHYNVSEFEKAEKYYKEAYEIRSRLSKSDPEKYESELAKTINNLANLYKRLNNIDQARELYEEALKLRERCANRNPKLYDFDKASALYNIGSLYMKLDQYDQAIEYVKRALEIEERLATESPEVYEYLHSYSTTLETLSHLYYIQDDYSGAEELCLNAISNIETLVKKNHTGFEKSYADILVHLSSIHQRLGNYDDADDEIQRALDIFNKLAIKFVGKYEEDIVYALRVIADNYCQRAQYIAAEDYIDKAMKISERLYSEDKSAYGRLHAISLYQRASIYTMLTDYDAAEQLYIKSLAIFEEMHNIAPEISNREQLIVKGYLADLYRYYKGEYENALPKYEELVKEYKALIAINNSITLQLDCAHLLSRLADCYEGMGDRVMYKNALKDTIAYYNTIKNETIATKTRIATLHLSLALAYSVDEEYEESFGYYQKAIDLYSDIYQSNPVSVTEYLGMAHRYYALSLEENYEDKAVEQYSYSLRYYLEDSILLGKSATEIAETFDEMLENIDRTVIFKYLYKTCPEVGEGFIAMVERSCDELNDKTRYQETLKTMISMYKTIDDGGTELNETIAHKLLLLALSYAEDEDYEESFEYFEEAISIYENELKSNGAINIEHLAMAYKYYALSRQGNEENDEALKLYATAFHYFIDYEQDSGNSIEEIDDMLPYIMSIDFENVDTEVVNGIIDSCSQYQNYLSEKNCELSDFLEWLQNDKRE